MKGLIVSLVLTLMAPLAWADYEADSMSKGELEEMIDDAGGGQNTSVHEAEDNDDDADVAIDKEIGTHGASEAMYDHATPEPPTRIPTGDKYNADYAKQAKKKLWAKKSKHKLAKNKLSKKKLANKSSTRKDRPLARHRSARIARRN